MYTSMLGELDKSLTNFLSTLRGLRMRLPHSQTIQAFERSIPKFRAEYELRPEMMGLPPCFLRLNYPPKSPQKPPIPEFALHIINKIVLFLRQFVLFDQILVDNRKRVEAKNAQDWRKIENEVCFTARQYWGTLEIVQQHIELDTRNIESEDERYEIAQKAYASCGQQYQDLQRSIDLTKEICDIIYKRIQRPPYWG